MQKESILYTVIGLLSGVLVTILLVRGTVNDNSSVQRMMGMRQTVQVPETKEDASMGMDAMTAGLKGRTGDAFDKAFLAEMIIHHQGAIEMAKLTEKSAKHEEIKQLAGQIIAAQTSEITQMQSWQLLWGYASSDSSGGMQMMGH